MSLLSTTAAEVWRAMGVELIIFIVTLAFALVLRTNSSKKAAEKSGKGFQKTVTASPHERPNRGKTVGDCIPQERASEKRWGQHKDPAHVIDEVVRLMREMACTRSANKALALYADLQSSHKDIRINDAARRSSYSAVDFYTTLVHCAIRAGKSHLVEGLLDDMSKQAVSRPLAFYESAMKQLAGQKHYHLALTVYDRLVADGLEPSAVTCSCLISFAAEVGELQRAIGFFEKLSSITTPSIRAYMTVLRVHAKRQDWPASLSVFREMQNRGARLDCLVLNVILSTGVLADQMEDVELLLSEADNFEPPISDVVSYNTVIKGYAQRNDARKAIQAISRMRQRGLKMNAITFNTAMDAAVRGVCMEEAWNLLKEMRRAGCKPDKFTCSILVKGLSKQPTSGHLQNCLEVLGEVEPSCDATLRSTLYHSILEVAAQVPDNIMLMKIFTQMQGRQVALTANAYRLLVQSLGTEGDVKCCRQIWQHMLSEDIRPQASIFVALLDSYLSQGQVDGALQAFESLRDTIKRENETAPRRIDSGALLEECRVAFIRSLCRSSRESEATRIYLQARTDGALANIDSATGMMLARLQADCGNVSHSWMTIEDMMSLGHKPNETLLNAFLSTCGKHAETFYAKALLEKASQHNIRLSLNIYATCLKIHGRFQQLQGAIAVFDLMTEKHGDPPAHVVVSLLQICFQCRQPAKAFEIMEKLEAKQKDQPLPGSIYAAVFDGCAGAGLISKGLQLVEAALQRSVSLPPDSIEALVDVAQRRGSAGTAEFIRLQQIAKEYNLKISASEAGKQEAA